MYPFKFVLVTLEAYDPKYGYSKWYELQPQFNEHIMVIDMENINENHK